MSANAGVAIDHLMLSGLAVQSSGSFTKPLAIRSRMDTSIEAQQSVEVWAPANL